MNAKQFLRRHYFLTRQIEADRQQLEDLKEQATAIGSFTYDQDKIQSSISQQARFENMVIKIADLERFLADRIAQQCKMAIEIRQKLDELLPDSNEKRILVRRYIQHMTFEQIAEAEHWSVRNVYYMHLDALNCFREAYENEQRNSSYENTHSRKGQ